MNPNSWRGEGERSLSLTGKREPDSDMRIELISVHFPKAAGTTLANLLRMVYGDALHLDYGHPPHDPKADEPIDRYPQIRAVHGHFHADRYREFHEARRITFLREPLDNLISIYFFWQAMPPSGYEAHERLLRDKPNIVEFSNYPEVQRLASQSYFGGVDMAAFDLIGFYEDRIRGLERLSALLDVKLDASLWLNSTSYPGGDARRAILEDPRVMGTLRDNLREDIAFYDGLRNRWS